MFFFFWFNDAYSISHEHRKKCRDAVRMQSGCNVPHAFVWRSFRPRSESCAGVSVSVSSLNPLSSCDAYFRPHLRYPCPEYRRLLRRVRDGCGSCQPSDLLEAEGGCVDSKHLGPPHDERILFGAPPPDLHTLLDALHRNS